MEESWPECKSKSQAYTSLTYGNRCSSCSVQCHSQHEQVELFARRHFQCDCGTTLLGEEASCEIGKRLGQWANDGNKYDSCFRNVFCTCGRDYDPATETDEMVQCLVCENWLHMRCLLPHNEEEGAFGVDDFDMLLCGVCTRSAGLKAILERYAGKEGTGVVVVDEDGKVYGRLAEESKAEEAKEEAPVEIGQKRAREESADNEDASKKVKLDDVDSTIAASNDPSSEVVKPDGLDKPTNGDSIDNPSSEVKEPSSEAAKQECSAPDATPSVIFAKLLAKEGLGASVFLQDEDWRDQWCRCAKVSF
jgi:E3 ubiquitin-protein ligase UBR7